MVNEPSKGWVSPEHVEQMKEAHIQGGRIHTLEMQQKAILAEITKVSAVLAVMQVHNEQVCTLARAGTFFIKFIMTPGVPLIAIGITYLLAKGHI